MRTRVLSPVVVNSVVRLLTPAGVCMGYMTMRSGRLPVGPFYTAEQALDQAIRDNNSRIPPTEGEGESLH